MPEPVETLQSDGAFDTARAALFDHDVFKPFQVMKYEGLSNALRDRRIAPTTPILLTELPPTPVALIVTQMAYHHVAQGDIAGHPWLVSF